MLSQLPLPEIPSKIPVPGETILLIDMLNPLPLTTSNVQLQPRTLFYLLKSETWYSRDGRISVAKIYFPTKDVSISSVSMTVMCCGI